jgi:hypothetical protein
MKQAFIYAVAAFLVSTAGTTLALVRSHRPAAVLPADSVRAHGPKVPSDSTPKAPIAHDSVPMARGAAAHDTSHAAPNKGPVPSPRQDSTPSAPSPDSIQPTSVGSARPAAPRPLVTTIPVDPVARAAAYKQVARMLSAMKPPEAAKVMAYLTDDEVEGLLRAVGPRQAADFLTNIPKERAAKLSRRLLAPDRSNSR